MSEAQDTVGSAKTLVAEADRVSLGRSEDEALAEAPVERRYREVAALGEGGMGEVRLVRDNVIGRDVALKRVHSARGDSHSRDRFFREARVQGQLEHPSIVPVYDLGLGPDKRPFFTMRRVRGRTLDMAATGANALSRHALLAAMSRVCLAVDFAHARGVVHRDLKPANVMVGDYGEVYVLDWGLAKLHASEPEAALPETKAQGERISSGSKQTEVGAVMGTPGYMAPEQVRGEPADARADVYALGACLFEVLAGVPLFPGNETHALLAATLAGADAHTTTRAPDQDVPVELEAICIRATRTNPSDRFESARALSDAIERFLEGDRDLERRRRLASKHASAAADLATKAFEVGSNESELRSQAMREVATALANDPSNADAKRVMVRLLTEPPRVVPADVTQRSAEERERNIIAARRLGAIGFAIILIPVAIVLWMGVRDWFWLVWTGAFVLGGALFTVKPIRAIALNRYLVLFMGTLGMLGASRIAGSFFVLPVMAMGLSVGVLLFPRVTPVSVAILAGLVGILLPFFLELAGVLPPSMRFTGDVIEILPHTATFRPAPTLAFLLFGSTVPLVVVCVYLARIRDRLRDAESRMRVQAWQLRQILPDEK